MPVHRYDRDDMRYGQQKYVDQTLQAERYEYLWQGEGDLDARNEMRYEMSGWHETQLTSDNEERKR